MDNGKVSRREREGERETKGGGRDIYGENDSPKSRRVLHQGLRSVEH